MELGKRNSKSSTFSVNYIVSGGKMLDIEERVFKGAREYGPAAFAIDVTSSCNFRCLHCFNESGVQKNDDMTDDEFFNVIRQICDMHPLMVCLCGGEPLTKLERVKTALALLKDNVGQINMVSNGWFATEDVLRTLKTLGLHTYQVSLDGKNAFQHDNFRCVRGAFDHAVAAIKNAAKVGLNPSVAITPTKLNYKSIEDIVDLCYNLGAKYIRSMPLVPMGRARFHKLLILSSDEYIFYQIKLRELKNKYMNIVSIEWGDPADHLMRMPANGRAGLNTFQMDIKSNGDIRPSTYLPIVIGNIRNKTLAQYWEDGFKNIWKKEKFLSIIKDITDPILMGKFCDEHQETIYLEM